ncbi:cytochrome c biogenesis protein [Allocatelliglobosispora scoriae]|uniref:Cytochrome c biogenesis protein n=1 Tax=Allocatelliglobosispora scoriae TaxID=643052 RepID=A0A841BVJ7_9ACTN|nr:cytochrome c biogenesis protein ResB [Allocatelliglobosispora scoriae]MBB5870790.1 cytochrome c biogenesis protein [Allocatelliglobosispora scoriae]
MSYLRNAWRQLTSMRTALVLLVLLAVAAIPGSVLPQHSVKAEDVARYYQQHPDLAPVLEKLWGFDVYRSPWFSSIYLLLFISLAGCIVPRLRDHARAMLRKPPEVPANLSRLPQHAAEISVGGTPAQAMPQLRGWRKVVREQPDGSVTISAERGFFKETGNLVFHTALIGVLIGVATGSLGGWHANRIVVAGAETAFCNTPQQLDEYVPGAWVSSGDLPKFCLELASFDATYLESGAPSSFRARGVVTGDQQRSENFSVNDPLRLDGANVYLIGHGYAPVLRYTDRYGRSQTSATPFLPASDAGLTSEGVATFPDANIDPKATGDTRDRSQQVAFSGLYLPTAPAKAPFVRSVYPAERNPLLVLSFFRGDLGIDAGVPRSVYTLDQRQIERGKLKQVGEGKFLKLGEAWTLDDGSKLEFIGTKQFAVLSIRHDPGEPIVLGSVAFLLAGLMLSLIGKRRRIFVRVRPDAADATRSLIEVGGLPRSDYPGFPEEFTSIVQNLQRADRS